MTDIACIGECMIELKQAGNGLYTRGYGGDTLNTAVYLARLGNKVRYVTALGDDPLSEEMIAGWAGEGIETAHVIRLPGKLPGLYLIRTDDRGERQFFHWRESAAARGLMDLAETADILHGLQNCKLVYFSAITLSIYNESGRKRLLAALRKARDGGTSIVFDTNFRARGWPDLEVARSVYRDAFDAADVVLASTEDLSALYPHESDEDLLAHVPSAEVVLKLPSPSSILRWAGQSQRLQAEPVAKRVVDTTAAGDSFAAAYISARLAGADPFAAARAGHRLAGIVVGYPGAIIPRSAMPERVGDQSGPAISSETFS